MAAEMKAETAETAETEETEAANEIFTMFDDDGDGVLSKPEYTAYLKGIGLWGTDWYNDNEWDNEGWPGECAQMKGDDKGIGREQFVDILYVKYRQGMAMTDLEAASPRVEVSPKSLEWNVERGAGLTQDITLTNPGERDVFYMILVSRRAHHMGRYRVDRAVPLRWQGPRGIFKLPAGESDSIKIHLNPMNQLPSQTDLEDYFLFKVAWNPKAMEFGVRQEEGARRYTAATWTCDPLVVSRLVLPLDAPPQLGDVRRKLGSHRPSTPPTGRNKWAEAIKLGLGVGVVGAGLYGAHKLLGRGGGRRRNRRRTRIRKSRRRTRRRTRRTRIRKSTRTRRRKSRRRRRSSKLDNINIKY